MSVIIDHYDLSKFDKKLDQLLQEVIEDLTKMAKEHINKGNVNETTAVAHFRYMLLKSTLILSQAIEKKTLKIIDNADSERLKTLFKDMNKP